MLYWQRDSHKIYHGHVLDELKGIPYGSVNCCITSPPYWALRDYKTEPQVWGGDIGCLHEWGNETVLKSESHHGLKNTTDLYAPRKNPRENNCGESGVYAFEASQGRFCRHCGAWYGQLGLEPTPELYVDHLVSIFQEVKRVLMDDGTFWLNLGDSYAGSWGDSGNRPERSGVNQGQRERNTEFIPRPGHPTAPKPATRSALKESTWELKPKDLVGIPWMVAFALRADGWFLRSDIIWHKPNAMPESVKDRPSKTHEHIFLLTKSEKYFYDSEAVKEKASENRWGGHKPINVENSKDSENQFKGLTRVRDMMPKFRNKRSVWKVPTRSNPVAHFATFPPKLIKTCILAGCPKGGTILDPFLGSGTTMLTAHHYDRYCIGIELSKTYLDDIILPDVDRATKQLKLFK